jgi:hypothetical protein
MASITINGITLDPKAQETTVRALGLHSRDASGSDFILIQTKAPLDKAQRGELASKGVQIMEYVPESTYLCHYPPADLDALRALSYVEWANVYLQGFKIAPSLHGEAPGRAPRELTSLATRAAPRVSHGLKKVDVIFHANVDFEKVRTRLANAVGLDPGDLKLAGNKVRIRVKAQRLAELARIDEVRHIEEVRAPKLHNDVARRILRVETGKPPVARFEGEGQVVAVCDTGFDQGSTSNVHPAFAGRVLKVYALGRANRASDPDGHGTHVAGSVLADGDSATLGYKVRGTAPKAKLVLQSVLDGWGGLGGIPDNLGDLFLPPYQEQGARIHTNSWGYMNGDGSYNSNSRELDDFVWSHRGCVVCFAAGNEGTDRDGNGRVNERSTTPPGTAKNCITVGASENLRPKIDETYGSWWPQDFPANPIKSDKMADDAEGMVGFSSRGPTADGRIKPDVVAPGTFILSTRSRATTDTGWAPSNDPLYFYMGGTSMATPLVAGCTALIREFLIKDQGIAQPSAALVKALLINGAANLDGQYVPSESGRVPNHSEGFGRVDMAATVGPFKSGVQLVLKDEGTELDSGEEEITIIPVTGAGMDLKVTLVWTDPPGEALQNDLDLIVRAVNGRERHGSMTANSRRFDRLNNVEQVTWRNLPVGDLEIVVRGWRITQFAQSYALAVRLS